ncbi:hypothetical protein NIES4102_05540 [Chondrocystis sp. NIES-4102]|nr:hypothetical protein NIES4102_05540 [Chondrocystis sp. NIES-4102]
MRDVITYRKHNSFEKAYGNNSLTFGKEDASGAIEDDMGVNYKIRATEISQVNRIIGLMAFVINTKYLDSGEGCIFIGYNGVSLMLLKLNDLRKVSKS